MCIRDRYKGVPLYMNAITSPENGNKARSSEADVWAAILQDLTDCVNEPNLPDKYNSGDSNYGRVTKGQFPRLRITLPKLPISFCQGMMCLVNNNQIRLSVHNLPVS